MAIKSKFRMFLIVAGAVLTGALTIAAVTQFGAVEVMARHN